MALSVAEPVDDGRTVSTSTGRGLFSPFLLAYALGAFLVAALVWAAGMWEIIASTRLLVPMMRLGVVALTDADSGFIAGIPDHTYLIMSQDPVDWIGVVAAILLLLVVVALRGARLRRVARLIGAPGSNRGVLGAAAYGSGVGAFYPYGYGQAATIAALEEQGTPLETAKQVVFIDRMFGAFDIVFFAALGIAFVGWSTTLGAMVPPLLFLAGAWYLTRRRRPGDEGPVRWARDAAAALGRNSAGLASAAAISVVAFAVEVAALFMIVQAFSSLNVIIDLDYRWLMLGVVGGYLASFIRITPGGLGQFEWGMALSLHIVSPGLPAVAVVAILTMIFRYIVSLIVLLTVKVRGAVQTGPPRVLQLLSEGAR